MPTYVVLFCGPQAGVRLTQKADGFVVTLSCSKPQHAAVSISRWRFSHNQRDAAAAQLLDLLYMVQGKHYAAMRSRAVMAVARMHYTNEIRHVESTDLRHLFMLSQETAEIYLGLGLELIRQCMEIKGCLIQAGFDPGHRPVPMWMDEIQAVRHAKYSRWNGRRTGELADSVFQNQQANAVDASLGSITTKYADKCAMHESILR